MEHISSSWEQYISKRIDAVQQVLTDNKGDGTPTDEESSQRTVQDEKVEIKVDNDLQEANDTLQGEPEEPYYYHNYVIPKDYTSWICDEAWPETDSEQDPNEISGPPMYDEWLDESREDDEFSSAEEDDDESTERMDCRRPITESDINELGLLAIASLDPHGVVNLPVIKDMITGLTGRALFDTAVTGLQCFQRRDRPLGCFRYPSRAIVIMNQAVGLEDEEDQIHFTWLEGSDQTKWDIILEALKVTQNTDETLLRTIVTTAIECSGEQDRMRILWPSLCLLSSTQKQELMLQALEKFQPASDRYSNDDYLESL
ncbi:hypothetical protein PHISCL_02269 [Aspergillus sclerotialis]|uniref:Uncharacterized protein n=1 Tax=Aspergillus sclerotialis TaxID=2070753 RepID=A0A3A2ZQF1_9EURO|nr:hypothetical protein PHISCL_02269 [Aspergillus sclerotialis]